MWELAIPPLCRWSWLDGPESKKKREKKKGTFPTFPLLHGEKSFSRVTAEDNSKITAKLLLTSPLSQVTSKSTLGFIYNASTASLLANKHTGPGWAQEVLGFSSHRLAWVKHIKRPRHYSTRGPHFTASCHQINLSLFLCCPIFKQLWFIHLTGPTWDASLELLHHGDLPPKAAEARLPYFSKLFHPPAQMTRVPGRQETFFKSSGADVAAPLVSSLGTAQPLLASFVGFVQTGSFH